MSCLPPCTRCEVLLSVHIVFDDEFTAPGEFYTPPVSGVCQVCSPMFHKVHQAICLLDCRMQHFAVAISASGVCAQAPVTAWLCTAILSSQEQAKLQCLQVQQQPMPLSSEAKQQQQQAVYPTYLVPDKQPLTQQASQQAAPKAVAQLVELEKLSQAVREAEQRACAAEVAITTVQRAHTEAVEQSARLQASRTNRLTPHACTAFLHVSTIWQGSTIRHSSLSIKQACSSHSGLLEQHWSSLLHQISQMHWAQTFTGSMP